MKIAKLDGSFDCNQSLEDETATEKKTLLKKFTSAKTFEPKSFTPLHNWDHQLKETIEELSQLQDENIYKLYKITGVSWPSNLSYLITSVIEKEKLITKLLEQLETSQKNLCI